MLKIIPENLDTSTLHGIMNELSSISNQNIIFDWKNCIHITDEAHCAILHLKELTKSQNIVIIHKCEQHRHRTLSVFEKVWTCEVDKDCVLTTDGVYVSPIIVESRLSSDIRKIIQFIKAKYRQPNISKDFSPIESILSELYMNICPCRH